MADHPDPVAPLPDPPLNIVCVGRKGQGKSELAWLLYDGWPADRGMLDTTGDLGKDHPDEATVLLEVPPPAHWPAHLQDPDDERLSVRYVPDMLAPDYREDMDRFIGLMFSHGDCLVLVEEAGLVAPAGQTFPHTRRALHMGRHKDLSMIFTMPRTVGVDPLVLAQADVIYAFDLPNPDDRKRLADIIGWDRGEVDDGMASLQDHGYLRFVTKAHELSLWPPLPLPKRKRHAQRHLEQGEPPNAPL